MDDSAARRLPVTDGVAPVLDLAFDSARLELLRARVRAQARQAGMSEDRIADVVLAVHELAGNALRHGPGEGRLRIWALPGALRCEVADGEPPAAGGQDVMNSWPVEPMHGLWVVRQLADQMGILSGPDGTRAMVTFRS